MVDKPTEGDGLSLVDAVAELKSDLLEAVKHAGYEEANAKWRGARQPELARFVNPSPDFWRRWLASCRVVS